MRPNQRASLDLSLPDTRPAERQHLPDIRAALSWRSWEDGREEARQRGMPILAFAEPSWANSAQRIALLLGRDGDLRERLESKVVPVLADPDSRPDLAAAWRRAAVALTGTAGPPLLVFLTHEGLPFLAYCTMNIEGDDSYPSLVSLVESVSEQYAANASDIVDEARNLDARIGTEATNPYANQEWEVLRQLLDIRRGGLDEPTKHPHPMLLWSLLDAHSRNELPEDIAAWLRHTLDALIRGGIWDQLDRGFHRCTRNNLWVVPHFEKPIPLNAQLMAVYARAASQLENDTYRDIASRLVLFCTTSVREGVDIIGSDTEYYTWTSKEFLTILDPALVQVVTLHYDIKPVHERQALRRVVEMEQMDRFSHEDINVLRTRLARGRAQLRAARLRRPSPAMIATEALAHRAVTITWLLKAHTWLDQIDVANLARELERFIDNRYTPAQGYRRDDGSVWLEDQAALLSAFVESHRSTGDAAWLDRARDLASVLEETWRLPDGWRDRPGSDIPSADTMDDIIPAAIPLLQATLSELAMPDR